MIVKFPISKFQFPNSQRGFTLVELILYMALLSVFLVVLTDIFVAVLNIKVESEATSAVDQDGRFILSRLNYDIKRMAISDTVSLPASFGPPASQSLSFTIGGVNYTYDTSGGNLRLTVGVSPSENLNSSETTVSGFGVQKLGNAGPGKKETLKIDFTVTSVTTRKVGNEVRSFQTTVSRR